MPYLFGDHRIVIARRADHLRPHRPGRRRRSPSPSGCASCCSARRSAPGCAPSSTTPSWPASTASARSSSPGCSWMIGFALAALGGVLFAGGENLNAIVLTLLVLNAYGAAMVGRLTSLPMTFVGALVLGLCQELTNVSWLWPDGDAFLRVRLAIPGLFLVARRAARAVVPAVGGPGRRAATSRAVPTLRRVGRRPAPCSSASSRCSCNVGPDDLQVARRPGARDRDDRPVARRAHRAVRPGLAHAVPVRRRRRVRRRQDLRRRQRARHAARRPGRRGARRRSSPCPSVRLRGPAPRAEHVRHRAHRPRGGPRRPARLRPRRPSGRPARDPRHLDRAPTPPSPCGARSCSSCSPSLVGVVRRSWFGRQLTAIRDSELAAATLGLRVRSTKVADLRVLGVHRRLRRRRSSAACPAPCDGTQFDPVNSLVILLFAFVGGITTVTGALRRRRRCSRLLVLRRRRRSPTSPAWCSSPSAPPPSASAASPNGLAGVLLDRVRRRSARSRRARRRSPAPGRRRRRGAARRARERAA